MRDKANKHFWERMAGKYTRVMGRNSSIYERMFEKIIPGLNDKMNVLELACGTGQMSFPLAVHTGHWEATDFSEEMIKEAEKRPAPENLHFSVQDATMLPYGDESFDAVVIANALHVMPYPETVLGEIYRVLKKDGVLYAPTFMMGTSLKGRIRIKILEIAGFHIFSRWDRESFQKYITDHSFEIKEFEFMEDNLLPTGYLMAVKKISG